MLPGGESGLEQKTVISFELVHPRLAPAWSAIRSSLVFNRSPAGKMEQSTWRRETVKNLEERNRVDAEWRVAAMGRPLLLEEYRETRMSSPTSLSLEGKSGGRREEREQEGGRGGQNDTMIDLSREAGMFRLSSVVLSALLMTRHRPSFRLLAPRRSFRPSYPPHPAIRSCLDRLSMPRSIHLLFLYRLSHLRIAFEPVKRKSPRGRHYFSLDC